MNNTTDFGFEQVPVEEKVRRVGQVFSSVANRYDLMNDLMSMGLHRVWKRFTIAVASVKPGQRVLDVAGGTGDLAASFAGSVGDEGTVVLTDINGDMLNVGRERLINRGIVSNTDYVQANAELLPFADNTFDLVTIAFGLRNVTDKPKALASMQRILRPGGRLLILEFSRVVLPLLRRLYDSYSFNVLPKLGEIIAKDRESYQYLVESIRTFPDQDTLLEMMGVAGFENTRYNNLSGGVVALHGGYKL